ncbi:MAG: helix-turn-helix domain-containing protein [Alphaproteobacteria bacterium]|nr:helix-turn-helix domain-containing protein [Alphaproteobacteria bacterium]
MAADSPLVLTLEQVADLLQVPTKAVVRLRSQRKIAFVKIGGKLRFRIEDVQEYLERATQPCLKRDERHGLEKRRDSTTTTSTGSTSLQTGLSEEAAALAIAAKLKKNSAASSSSEPAKQKTKPPSSPPTNILSLQRSDGTPKSEAQS